MLTLLLLACSPAPDSAADTAGGPNPDEALWSEARGVLDENCARCHTDGGQALSFDEPEAAAAYADAMVAAVEAGRMPPAAPEPDYAPYIDSDRFTADAEELAALRAWAEAGAPLGSAVADPPSLQAVTGPFDLELFGGAAYTPEFAGDGNDYRCFLLSLENEEVVYLTGMEALVDELPIVHHVVLFEAGRGADIPQDTDPSLGFACSGLGGAGWSFVGAWAPGANAVIFPEGSGMRFGKNTELVLQMHYFNSFDGASELSDQSGYGLHLADEVEREVVQQTFGATSFTIPAGEADHAVSATQNWVGNDADLLGVWPHMHVLGAGIEEKVEHADGSTSPLLFQSRWNFHNQVYAGLEAPVRVSAGDRVSVTCRFDNSTANPEQLNDPPVDVEFGEETGNEMCFGFTYALEVE